MRAREDGTVLVNVLVTLALAATLLHVMITGQERAIDRAVAMSARAQARVLAEGGVASVITALRRDMVEGPDADHFSEPWAQVVQAEIMLPEGRYSVSVEDAQARFNINLLVEPTVQSMQLFSRLLAALDIPEGTGAATVRALANGPVLSLEDLARRGVGEDVLEQLTPHIVALPEPTAINLNTAERVVLQALLGNERAARGLLARRSAKGALTTQDLRALGLVQPIGSGWTSGFFDVSVVAEVDGVRQHVRSRVQRVADGETNSVFELRRFHGAFLP
ncbi:MAG: general secretion pathway protein GspK [Pseudomonadota bacterium]